MSITEILAVIGGVVLILTAAARIPAAIAEFLQAWRQADEAEEEA